MPHIAAGAAASKAEEIGRELHRRDKELEQLQALEARLEAAQRERTEQAQLAAAHEAALQQSQVVVDAKTQAIEDLRRKLATAEENLTAARVLPQSDTGKLC